MKTFLILLSGIVFGVLVFGGGAFYFLRSGGISENSNFSKATAAIKPADQIKIPFTFMVPPQLEGVVKNGTGSMVINAVNFPPSGQLVPGALVIKSPAFPFNFDFIVDRNNLIKQQGGQFPEIYFWASYFDSSSPGAAPYLVPTAVASLIYPLKISDEKNNTGPVTLGAKQIFFLRNFTQPILYKCPPPATFSGIINPSASFKNKYEKKKVALVVLPYMNKISSYDFSVPTDSEFDELVVHYQVLDFSKGPAPFSFREKPMETPFYRMIAVVCRDGDSLRTCAMGAFPAFATSQVALIPGARERFRIVGKKLEMPYCGNNSFEGVVSLPNSSSPSSK